MAISLSERMSYFVSEELEQFGSDNLLELRDKKSGDLTALIYRQPLREKTYLLATGEGYFILDFSKQYEESRQVQTGDKKHQPICLDVLERLIEGDVQGLSCQIDFGLEKKQAPALTRLRIEHNGQEYSWVQGDAGMKVEAVDLVHPGVAFYRAKLFMSWARWDIDKLLGRV